MKEYIGEYKVEMDGRYFSRLIFDEGVSSVVITDIDKTYHPVGLPSGAKYLTYIKWEYQIYPSIAIIFEYKYIASNGTEQTVTDSQSPSDYTSVWYPNVHAFFGDEIDILCRVQIYGDTSFIEQAIYNNLSNASFIRTSNAIFLYTMNSSKNTVSKSITFVGNMYIKYNKPISYKQLSVDLELEPDEMNFNYVYITVLNRYYYVTDMNLIKNYCSITLSEDVLMSWADVIRSQTAFVERSQSSYSNNLVDDEVMFDYDKNIAVTPITPTAILFPTTQAEEDTRKSVVITTVIG